jgi:hypothetical protein
VSSVYCTIENSDPQLSGSDRDSIPLCEAEMTILWSRYATSTNSSGDRVRLSYSSPVVKDFP